MAISWSSPTFTVTGGKDTGTATGGATSSLTDTGKSWSSNDYAGRFVRIHAGTGAGQIRYIGSNNSTVLNVQPNWDTNPDSTSQYIISYDFSDIDAADSGSVLTVQGDYYEFQSGVQFLVIGDGSTQTFLADTNKTIKFLYTPTANHETPTIRRQANAVFQLGVSWDDANIVTSDGCKLVFNTDYTPASSGYTQYIGHYGYASGYTHVYASSLEGTTYRVYWVCDDSTNLSRLWDTFTGNGLCIGGFHDTSPFDGSTYLDCKNIISANCDYNMLAVSGDLDGVKTTESIFAHMFLPNTDGDITYSNLNMQNSSLNPYAGGSTGNHIQFGNKTDGDVTFSNCETSDPSDLKIFWSSSTTAVVYWTFTFDLTIVDSGASAISGVRVYLEDTGGTEKLNTTTDGSGVITQANVNQYSYVRASDTTSTKTIYNPYTYKLRKYGYIFLEQTKSFTRQSIDQVTLLTNSFVTLSDAAAAALTNITIVGDTSITLATANKSISQLYDYSQAWGDDSGNIQYAEAITTVDGSTYTLNGYNLTLSGVDLTGTGTLAIGSNSVNLNSGADVSLTLDGGTININTVQAYVLSLTTNTVNFTAAGTYDLTGCSISGTATFTATATVTVQVSVGTLYDDTDVNVTVVEVGDIPTLTVSADSATATVRGFTNDTQTTVFIESDGSVDYEYPNTSPIDIEIVEQGYVPINEQDVVPFDGPINYTMDLDEAYNASHALTIVTHYTFDRGTKNFNILADQNAFDVRSSMADTIRTNSSYYNTPLLLEAKPGGKRIDLINGATITSMATWKGAGMERYDAADAINPVEKWYAVQSVNDITGSSVVYRQTDSGDFAVGALTGGKFNETLQFYDDSDHDGTPTTENNDYLLIKALRVGYLQARNDVVAGNGGASLKADLYTIGLAPTAHDYSGGPIDLSATMTLVAGGTVGGKTFSYKWVDAGTNSGTDIADWINYMGATSPNGIIPGGTGLRWAEMPDMVIYVTGGVETAQGYREGATPTLVGFYMERGGADHPDMVRAQADDGTYYTPAVTANITIINLPDDVGGNTRLQIYNVTTATEYYSDDPAGTGYSASYTDGVGISAGDSIRVRFAHLNGATSFESGQTFATASTSGFSVDGSTFITANSVYADNAIDGSSITKFTADFVNDELDVSSAANFTGPETWAFFCMTLTTANGIAQWWGGYEAIDIGNYRNNSSVVSMYFDETFGSTKRQTDSSRIFRSDGVYPVKDPTTTGYGVDINWQVPVYVKEVNTGSAVNKATVIEALTDQGYTSTRAPKLDTIPDDVWQSPKAIPKLLSVE